MSVKCGVLEVSALLKSNTLRDGRSCGSAEIAGAPNLGSVHIFANGLTSADYTVP